MPPRSYFGSQKINPFCSRQQRGGERKNQKKRCKITKWMKLVQIFRLVQIVDLSAD